jgi:hypothetical protein
MNFALGADVDADGRPIENHDLWFKIQASRDQDTLLIAARKAGEFGDRATRNHFAVPQNGYTVTYLVALLSKITVRLTV